VEPAVVELAANAAPPVPTAAAPQMTTAATALVTNLSAGIFVDISRPSYRSRLVRFALPLQHRPEA
jgi:hypothetical protein